MAKTYDVMGIQEFGDALLRTGDLDPVYFIRSAELPRDQLARLLLAYWCFYHLGAACWLSEWEGTDYWNMMLHAARNDVNARPCNMPGIPQFERWPRAPERRHFRGDKCVRAVDYLSRSANPEMWVRALENCRTEEGVMHAVSQWPQFGPWIAFKAADMMERVWGAPIKFNANIGLIYAEPRTALTMMTVRNTTGGPPYQTWPDLSPQRVYERLLTYFSARRAPPARDRSCGPQEVETILCKWKSHVNGSYPVGKDIREVRHGLAGWGRTAERMLTALPGEVV